MKGLTIIVPVFNEEDSISSTFSKINDNLKKTDINYEIIAIDDGSDDSSFNLLREHDFIIVEKHKINKGYGASIKTGLRLAKFDSICITDADGTYPNEKISELYDVYIEDKLDMLPRSSRAKSLEQHYGRTIDIGFRFSF